MIVRLPQQPPADASAKILQSVFVLAIAVAALASALAALRYGGVFNRTTPPLIGASIGMGVLSLGVAWTPWRRRLVAIIGLLLALSLAASVWNYYWP